MLMIDVAKMFRADICDLILTRIRDIGIDPEVTSVAVDEATYWFEHHEEETLPEAAYMARLVDTFEWCNTEEGGEFWESIYAFPLDYKRRKISYKC